jgi:ubiquinone/menaquinone biosynthesis C-methylase UbiE
MKWIYRHPVWYDLIDGLCSLGLSGRVRRKALAGTEADSFLEIGVGSGKSLALIDSGYTVGLDRSKEMLLRARRRLPASVLVVGDAHMLPFRDACFGASIFSYCLRGLARPADAVREAVRVSSLVYIIDYDKPRLMPGLIWEKLIGWFSTRVFGSKDLDYGLLAQAGSSSWVRDVYGGLYKVIVLKGAVHA